MPGFYTKNGLKKSAAQGVMIPLHFYGILLAFNPAKAPL
jgi:hypothetical protein